jgi:hypothetical protein
VDSAGPIATAPALDSDVQQMVWRVAPRRRFDQLSAFNEFTQAEAGMFRKFTHLMFS